MKFFIWVIEFKIKCKENKAKIKYLVERLIKELESQGHDLGAVSGIDCKYISIFEHQNIINIYSGDGNSIQIEKQVNEYGK